MTSKEEFYKNYRAAVDRLDDIVTGYAEQTEYVLEKCEELTRLVDKLDADNWESIAEQMRDIIANIEWSLK